MKKIMLYNADECGEIAKTILAGCYKFGCATLLRRGGATMTSVIEYEEEDKFINTDAKVLQEQSEPAMVNADLYRSS